MVDPDYSDDPGMSYEDYNAEVAAAKEKALKDIKRLKIIIELSTRISAHDLFVAISALCPKHNVSVEEISEQNKAIDVHINIPKSSLSMEACLDYLIGLFKRPLTANEITTMEETYKLLNNAISTKDQKFINNNDMAALKRAWEAGDSGGSISFEDFIEMENIHLNANNNSL